MIDRKELFNNYTHLYAEDKRWPIWFGFECGAGWLPWIKELLESFEWHRTHNLHLTKEGKHEITITQIKEKFGTLRVYFNSNPEIMDALECSVARAIAKCQLTCEVCGVIGDKGKPITPTEGWISYLCSECKEKK